MSKLSTRDRILDSAQALAQKRGFNGYSYADIAAELDIRKASIHYHFPSKHDLEAELLDRYRTGFNSVLSSIETTMSSSVEKLQQYANMYIGTFQDDKICLSGMMASDVGALPDQIVPSLTLFFEDQTAWIARVMNAGKSNGELNFTGSVEAQASLFLSALQGGLLIANATGDETVFVRLKDTLIAQLS